MVTLRRSGKGKGRGNNSQSSHFPPGKSGNPKGRPRKDKVDPATRTMIERLVDAFDKPRELQANGTIKIMTGWEMLCERLVASIPKAKVGEQIKLFAFMEKSLVFEEYNRRVLDRLQQIPDPYDDPALAKFKVLEGFYKPQNRKALPATSQVAKPGTGGTEESGE